MKKWSLLICLALLALLLTGCGGTDTAGQTDTGRDKVPTTAKVPEILNQAEYLLYQNVFYNDYGAQIEGQRVIKRGVLGKIQDVYNGCVRYYVCGYLDNTLCCDWQWEIVPRNEASLPPVGSLVTATGTFRADENALDGYWIVEAVVDTDTRYVGPQGDLNMRALTCTLERVQMFNILYRPEAFEEKSFMAWGRIAGPGMLEDPVYNGSWQIAFTSDEACPAIGTQVAVQGKVKGGVLSDCGIEIMQ